MKRYIFPLWIGGYGDTPEEAWQDAIDNLDFRDLFPDGMPEEYRMEKEEFEG